MSRIFLFFAVGLAIISNTGCLINAYSSDPSMRVKALVNQSEDLRQIEQEWSRIWFTDHPSHLTNERVDGGLQ
ncbi:MAG: hypothetical protein EBT92_04455 [Planctomycetes bacterium]|nr:hypothetical protein [Planctomycetota bacterium]NBY02559.1 hypothetical protein [Planctomycetota bacterium]